MKLPVLTTSVTLAGKRFNYEMVGSGDAVVHVLGLEPRVVGVGANARNTGIPKLAQFLKNNFTVISYENYNPAGPQFATEAESEETVSRITEECIAFLQHLGVSRVHIFAHRQVGYVAIKLALERPDLVRTISFLDFEIINRFLLKPKAQMVMNEVMRRNAANPKYQQRMEMLRQMMEAAKTGTVDGEPVDPEILAELSRIPKSYSEYFAPGADQSDPQSLQIRTFASTLLSAPYEEVASKVKQPILAAVSQESEKWAPTSADLMRVWLRQTEIFQVPKKSHWFSGQNDEGLAAGLADFYSRNSLS